MNAVQSGTRQTGWVALLLPLLVLLLLNLAPIVRGAGSGSACAWCRPIECGGCCVNGADPEPQPECNANECIDCWCLAYFDGECVFSWSECPGSVQQ